MPRLILFAAVLLTVAGCTPQLAEFEVQRPARLSVPRAVQKVFIRQDLVEATNDRLGLKAQVLQELAKQLNQLGRFRVQVVDTLQDDAFDPNRETVAVIQGEVVSGSELDTGQFTDVATCTRGIAGRASTLVAAASASEVVTADQLVGFCRRGEFKSDLVEGALGMALMQAGAGGLPPKNQVVRVYDYRNVTLFAQVNFSFTLLGTERETLAFRADAASYGRQVVDPKSFRHVKETHLVSLTLGQLVSNLGAPVFPNPDPLASDSNPRQVFYNAPTLPEPGPNDLPREEQGRLVKTLIDRSLESFIQTVSPYKVTVKAEVSTSGNSRAAELLQSGRPVEARKVLEGIQAERREAADWYHLGLAYEASAVTLEDYEDARRFYLSALQKESGNALYALGVGRTERVLQEARRLQQQLSDRQ